VSTNETSIHLPLLPLLLVFSELYGTSASTCGRWVPSGRYLSRRVCVGEGVGGRTHGATLCGSVEGESLVLVFMFSDVYRVI
jgi:hypothetical protein